MKKVGGEVQTMTDFVPALSIFILIVALMMVLRCKIGERFIKNSDILIAIVPIALWLILAGKIRRPEFGEFKIGWRGRLRPWRQNAPRGYRP